MKPNNGKLKPNQNKNDLDKFLPSYIISDLGDSFENELNITNISEISRQFDSQVENHQVPPFVEKKMIQPRVKYNSHNNASYSMMNSLNNIPNMNNMNYYGNQSNMQMPNFPNQMFPNGNHPNGSYYQAPTYNTMNHGLGQSYPMNFYNNRVPPNYPGFAYQNQMNYNNNYNLSYVPQNMNYSAKNMNFPNSKGNSKNNSGDLSNLLMSKKSDNYSQKSRKSSNYSRNSSDNDSFGQHSTDHKITTDTIDSFEAKPKAARKKPNSDMTLHKFGEGKRKTSLFMNQLEESKKTDNVEDFPNFIANLNSGLHAFICSQKGSRVMQKLLNKISPDHVSLLINSLGENISYVMTDLYGNYFCQKLIQICSADQRILIFSYIKNNIVQISSDSSGTHVLQSLIDIINLKEEEIILLDSIRKNELQMAYDNNATHVIQKIIVCIEENKRDNLNNTLLSKLKDMCLNSNGICIVKKMITTNNSEVIKNKILEEIKLNCLEIAQSPYGNYAIQYIYEEWGINRCKDIVSLIKHNIYSLSMQKFSSNVVEKTLELEEDKNDIINYLFNHTKIMGLLKNKYGKYVLHKAVKFMSPVKKQEMREMLSTKVNVPSLKEKGKIDSFIQLLKN